MSKGELTRRWVWALVTGSMPFAVMFFASLNLNVFSWSPADRAVILSLSFFIGFMAWTYPGHKDDWRP